MLPRGQVPDASEEVWEHRLTQRRRAIDDGKATQEYQNYAAREPRGDASDPRRPRIRTPDPSDRISKRSWKHQIQVWRKALKDWTRLAAAEPASGYIGQAEGDIA